MAKKRRKFRPPTQLALRRDDLDHFDMLPPVLRHRLNDANVKFSAHVVFDWWQCGMSLAQIVRQLKLNEDEFAKTWPR